MKLKTRQEIANAYGITRRTLYERIKAANVKLKRGLVGRKELKKIERVMGKIEDDKFFNE